MRLPNGAGEWLGSIASVVAILAACGALYLHLYTDAEAAELKADLHAEIVTLAQQLEQSNKNLKTALDRSEILDLTREVRRLEEKRMEPGISPEKAASIDTDIKYYNGLITCIRQQLPVCQ